MQEYHCHNENVNYINLKMYSTFFQMYYWESLQSDYALNYSIL